MFLTQYALAALSAGVAGAQVGSAPPPLGQPPMHKRHGRSELSESELESNVTMSGGRKFVRSESGWSDGCGYAKVVNKCPFDVYLYSVGWETDGPYTLGCDEEYCEEFEEGGVALEIVTDKGSWHDDCDKLVFYYKLAGRGEVFYDLYEKYGHPFEGHEVALCPEDRSCPTEIWDDGCDTGDDYDKKCCDDSKDLVLYLCDEDSGYGGGPPRHRYRPPPPPPPPPPHHHRPPPEWYPPPPPPPPPPHHRRPPPEWYPPPPPPPPDDDYPPCGPECPPPCYDDDGILVFRRSLEGAEGTEETNDVDWHARQWENDKPDWDTDAKCTDCGERKGGWISAYDNTTDVRLTTSDTGDE